MSNLADIESYAFNENHPHLFHFEVTVTLLTTRTFPQQKHNVLTLNTI